MFGELTRTERFVALILSIALAFLGLVLVANSRDGLLGAHGWIVIAVGVIATFAAAGAGLEDVVKSQVFLTDLDDFFYFDQVWREFFPSPPPRTTVQVGALLVPGCRVEIDLVAAVWGQEDEGEDRSYEPTWHRSDQAHPGLELETQLDFVGVD